MSGRKLALFAGIALVMLYMAGGEVLVSAVLQYLLSQVTVLLTSILSGIMGLIHIITGGAS